MDPAKTRQAVIFGVAGSYNITADEANTYHIERGRMAAGHLERAKIIDLTALVENFEAQDGSEDESPRKMRGKTTSR